MAPQILIAKLFAGGIAILATLRSGLGLYAWKVTEQLERPTYTVIQKLTNGIEIRKYDPYMIAETTIEKEQDDGLATTTTTTTTSSFRDSTGTGFRTCAEYIFGKNKKIVKSKNPLSKLFLSSSSSSSSSSSNENEDGEKMAMTAPVRISGQIIPNNEKMAMTAPVRIVGGSTSKKTKVSFVIGKQYTMKTAPIPLNNKVKLRNIPSHTLAVRTFSGPPPKDERVVKERALIDQTLHDVGMKSKSTSETLVYGYHDPIITPNILRRNEVAVLLEGSI